MTGPLPHFLAHLRTLSDLATRAVLVIAAALVVAGFLFACLGDEPQQRVARVDTAAHVMEKNR